MPLGSGSEDGGGEGRGDPVVASGGYRWDDVGVGRAFIWLGGDCEYGDRWVLMLGVSGWEFTGWLGCVWIGVLGGGCYLAERRVYGVCRFRHV